MFQTTLNYYEFVWGFFCSCNVVSLFFWTAAWPAGRARTALAHGGELRAVTWHLLRPRFSRQGTLFVFFSLLSSFLPFSVPELPPNCPPRHGFGCSFVLLTRPAQSLTNSSLALVSPGSHAGRLVYSGGRARHPNGQAPALNGSRRPNGSACAANTQRRHRRTHATISGHAGGSDAAHRDKAKPVPRAGA